MNLCKTMLSGLIATALTLGGGIAATGQDGTPESSPSATPAERAGEMHRFPMATPDGKIAAYVEIREGEDGVTLKVTSTSDSTLEPGLHGIHIHEVGSCDASGATPYESSGGHFNPTDAKHGDIEDDESHAGDLGNIEVAEDGTISFQVTTDKVTLDPAAGSSLAGPSGTSIIIHAGEDDLETDPSGDSGDRAACGVISRSDEPAMNAVPPTSASPAASPEATPAT